MGRRELALLGSLTPCVSAALSPRMAGWPDLARTHRHLQKKTQLESRRVCSPRQRNFLERQSNPENAIGLGFSSKTFQTQASIILYKFARGPGTGRHPGSGSWMGELNKHVSARSLDTTLKDILSRCKS